MSFSAGGANVSGVQQTEKGTLKISVDSIAVPTVSNNSTTFTVPAGKKWVLKNTMHSSSSLVATVGDVQVRITIGADTTVLYSGSSSKAYQVLPQQLLLTAGTIIELTTQLTAYTSGTLNHTILYLESDA